MLQSRLLQISVLTALSLGAVACSESSGTLQQQGGASGATGGAVVGGEGHRLLGGLLSGALGAVDGYIIGAETDKIRSTSRTAAVQANNGAVSLPASVQDINNSDTADLNHDGFVTLDEVIALSAAGLPDEEILRRLQATDQVLELTDDQRRYLRDHGVSQSIIDQIPEINGSVREQFLQSQAPSPR